MDESLKKLLNILKKVFFITDKVISSLSYIFVILIITIYVSGAFLQMASDNNVDFIWDLVFFSFTFISVFGYFFRKGQYSFDEFVMLMMPIGALILLVALGIDMNNEQNLNIVTRQVASSLFGVGIVLIAFSLTHTTVLLCGKKLIQITDESTGHAGQTYQAAFSNYDKDGVGTLEKMDPQTETRSVISDTLS